MLYEIIFSPESEKEILTITSYYDEKKFGLGLEVFQEIESHLALIKEHPELFPKAFKNFRKITLTIFPYLIYYSFDKRNKIIEIVSVYDTSRNFKMNNLHRFK